MQTCKRIFSLSLLLVFAPFFIFSQGMEMPEMPSMPSISLDGSFYKPTFQIPEPISPTPPKEVEMKEETIISENKSTDDILSSIINDSQTLTAEDISDLNDFGLFSDVTSLLGITSGSSSNLSNNANNTVLLQQILKELDELKKEQQNASNSEKENNINAQKDNSNFMPRNPSILRFKINDYDITDSLVEVFLSSPSDDGSFLLTADRRYVANGKNRNETFYLLFSPVKEAQSNVSYTIEATISQDYENKNSFIYKLCQKHNLTAQKTGNLVVVKYNDRDMKIDLLLDIDKR